MKFIILKKNLKDGLRAIEKITTDNLNLPILKNFLIESFDNKIKLSATNLELAITTFISGKIIENGGITVPLGVFSAIINNLQSERVNIELKNNKLLIKTDNYGAEIQGVKKEEFPIIPKITDDQFYLEINNSILKNSLISIIDSVGVNARPEFNGILFDYQSTLLKLAATDSFRLSEKTIFNTQFESNFNKNFKIIIPAKTIFECIKELQNNENGKTIIYVDSSQILFKTENTEIISRLISGEFPQYQQIIPSGAETEILLGKNELINALKLAGIFTDRLNEIKFNFQKDLKNIEIFSHSQSLGENKYLIPAKIKSSAKNAIPETIFNWRFFLDGIKNIESENVFIGLNSPNKPALIKSPEDVSWFYVLMPIKG